MKTAALRTASAIGTLLAATSCTVYVPMQPVMPLVRQRGDIEAGASLQPSGRLEVQAAYSPLPHYVVAGAGTWATRLDQQNYLVSRQGEAGLGGYWSLSPKWLLSTLAGGGAAYTDRQYTFWGTERRAGSYSKAFGQVGLAYVGEQGSFSLSYRLAHVSYRELETEIGPLSPFHTQRHEVLLATRWMLGSAASWCMQSTIGMSYSSLQPPRGTGSSVDSDRWFAAGVPVPVASLGVVWQLRR
jgi:hypothetical protein